MAECPVECPAACTKPYKLFEIIKKEGHFGPSFFLWFNVLSVDDFLYSVGRQVL